MPPKLLSPGRHPRFVGVASIATTPGYEPLRRPATAKNVVDGRQQGWRFGKPVPFLRSFPRPFPRQSRPRCLGWCIPRCVQVKIAPEN